MARSAYKIPINSETSREDLELCLVEAEHSSDVNVQQAAARARAELWRREQQEWRERFNAESIERVNAQKSQDAQITKQIEAQERSMGQQIEVAKGAATAAKCSAVATVVIAVLTTFLVAIGAFPILAPVSSDMPAPQPPPAATENK